MDEPSSSDEEYFPTEEELNQEDEDEDEDYNEAEASEEEEEEEEEEEVQGQVLNIDDIMVHQSPNFLRQIQEVLQRTIAARVRPVATERTTAPHGSARPRHRPRRLLQDIAPIPFPEGKRLINSGEFGAIDDRTHKKRRFEGARTVTQFARYRELGGTSKRGSTVAITKGWLPKDSSGRIVAQYDRHVYSGQFSHDGSFFYTASQDFKCRMYSTPNPANPEDWTLYKVLPPPIPTTRLHCSL